MNRARYTRRAIGWLAATFCFLSGASMVFAWQPSGAWSMQGQVIAKLPRSALPGEYLKAQLDNFQGLTQRATQAYEAKDYATYRIVAKQILAYTPRDPRAIYNAACGEALTGHPAESVHLLDELLARHLDLGSATDPDFNNIHESAEWKQYKDRLAVLLQPAAKSTTAFTLADKSLTATSVAVDDQTGDVYVASARERKIVKRSKNGAVSDFATRKDGLLAVWFLLIDPVHRELIASTAAIPFMEDFKKEDAGKSGVCVFDLATGKLLRQAFLPGDDEPHLLAAMALDSHGSVFVVDGATFGIFRLRRASTELELYISSIVFHAPIGLALSPDERTLYVMDAIDGLWAVDVLSTDRRHLDAPPDVLLNGVVGLTRVASGFIAVQSGIQPNRVVRIRLDSKAERVESVETLESNLPGYSGPAQGTLSGSDFLYIANSQLALGNVKTGAFNADKAQPTVVLSLALAK